MASEDTKMAVRGNMHMDTRVFKVAGLKLEAAKALEATT